MSSHRLRIRKGPDKWQVSGREDSHGEKKRPCVKHKDADPGGEFLSTD